MKHHRLDKNLNILRRKSKMSLAVLADKANMSPSYICEIERGRADNPTLSTLISLSEGFEMSLPDLMMSLFPESYTNHNYDYDEIVIINKLKTLSKENQAILHLILKKLLSD